MIELSRDKILNIIERIKIIIDVDDEEIKDCALIALQEEFEDLLNNKDNIE